MSRESLNTRDVQKDNLLEMVKLNLNIPLIAWDNEKSNMGVDFQMGEIGHVNVQGIVDVIKDNYQIDLNTPGCRNTTIYRISERLS